MKINKSDFKTPDNRRKKQFSSQSNSLQHSKLRRSERRHTEKTLGTDLKQSLQRSSTIMVDKIGNMARDRGLSLHATEGKISQLNRKLTKMTTKLFG